MNYENIIKCTTGPDMVFRLAIEVGRGVISALNIVFCSRYVAYAIFCQINDELKAIGGGSKAFFQYWSQMIEQVCTFPILFTLSKYLI